MPNDYDVEKTKWNAKAAETLQNEAAMPRAKDYDEAFSTMLPLRPVREFFELGPGRDAGLQALDYGCGNGWSALILSQKVGRLCSFDIAINRIRVLNAAAARHGFDNIRGAVANGEALPYADNSFDLVFGNAIIHHLDYDRALAEIARVLKPGGKAAFCEPFAHNPLINLYRYVKHHHVLDHEGTDHPLSYGDRAVFDKHFSETRFVESSLFSERLPALRPVETCLLKCAALRRFASYVSILSVK